MTTEELILEFLNASVLPVETQVAAFLSGAGFISPLLAFAIVKRFARKAARSEVLE